jgi:ATP-binding cassette subfamily F protein 3
VCDEFWLVSRGGVAPFDGDLEDYQRYLLEEAKRLREQAAALQAQARAQASESAVVPTPAVSAAPTDPIDVSPATTKEQRQLAATQRKALLDQKRPLKKELDQVDARLASLQKEQTQLHEQLSTQGDASAIAQAGKRLKEVDEALETLEMRWLELSQALEQIEAQLV